jgi:hypothetical protein
MEKRDDEGAQTNVIQFRYEAVGLKCILGWTLAIVARVAAIIFVLVQLLSSQAPTP